MSERSRDILKPEFRDGERPSGSDFADLIDSCVNKTSDGVSFDADGNLLLNRGVRLGDSAGTAAGGLRFNSNQLQVFTGGAWVNVSGGGGGGAFQPPPTVAPTAVAHDGNVGIGNFAAAPTFRLEVNLAANTGPGEQVRFGNVVCANGSQTTVGSAVFSHRNHASNANFALRQGANGSVQINAVAGQAISVSQGGGQVNFGVSASGRVIVGGDNDLPGAPAAARLHVNGGAFKNDGNADWAFTSDARVKEDIRDLELGLSELRQVRTVRFRYNGRGGTSPGLAGVGVLGQEIEAIFPETIQRITANDPGGAELDDLRVFDPSMLRYVLINAVKELAARVEHLERALAEATAAASRVPAIE